MELSFLSLINAKHEMRMNWIELVVLLIELNHICIKFIPITNISYLIRLQRNETY